MIRRGGARVPRRNLGERGVGLTERRAILYSETNDFENWPTISVIHHHVIDDGPDFIL